VADELGVDPFQGPGVMVIRVGRGFSMNAGLRPGDMIRSVNGREIRNVRDLTAAATAGAEAGAWQVTIQRNGQPVTANFRL
jgi:S1-C subfamily serine protease